MDAKIQAPPKGKTYSFSLVSVCFIENFIAKKMRRNKLQTVAVTPLGMMQANLEAAKPVSLKDPTEEFEVDCDMTFGANTIRVNFYNDSFSVLVEEASKIAQVPSFVMHQVVFVKRHNDLKIVDYFETPFVEQPIGTYKGRARIAFKTHTEFIIVPHFFCFFLFYKY